MMKQVITFSFGTLIVFQSFASINFIDISKISTSSTRKLYLLPGDTVHYLYNRSDTSHKNIIAADKNKDYSKRDIWTVQKGDKITFTSRPLGIKILIDPLWNLTFSDYQKRQSIFSITPPPIAGKKGKPIEYTIAILFKTADDKDKLDDYISKFVSKYPNKIKIDFSDKYEKMTAYEIKDKKMYKGMGGGHLYMIGIERNRPEYPGFPLEDSVLMPEGKMEAYPTASETMGRFNGKIFYAILLDTAEDIHDKSFAIFKTFFENQIIIE